MKILALCFIVAALNGCVLARGLTAATEARVAVGIASDTAAMRALSQSSPAAINSLTSTGGTHLGARMGASSLQLSRFSVNRVGTGRTFLVDGVRLGRVEANGPRALVFDAMDRAVASVYQQGAYLRVIGPDGMTKMQSVIAGNRISHYSALDGRIIGSDRMLKDGRVSHYDKFDNLVGTTSFDLSHPGLSTADFSILAAAALFGVWTEQNSRYPYGG